MASSAALVYTPRMAAYDLGPLHPLKPERFSLAVDLLSDYGVLGESIDVVDPRPASQEQLERVHTRHYLDLLRMASAEPESWTVPQAGIGTADDPVFHGAFDASALICGSTVRGLRAVLDGEYRRAMSIAGGLHHAMADHASGFCFLNDPAVAIADALASDARVRVAYIDVDAHHGDGVQAAFYAEPRVLTVSVHESGTFLFPGTGWAEETGRDAGAGTSANLPLPPHAGDECYRLAMRQFVEPVVERYRPDVIVAQLGADAHHADPLTSMGLTLRGYTQAVYAIVELADRVCDGRIAATGGGGYGAYSVVPRAWAMAAAWLAGVRLPDELPETWRDRVATLSAAPVPRTLWEDDYGPGGAEQDMLVDMTRRAIRASLDALERAQADLPR